MAQQLSKKASIKPATSSRVAKNPANTTNSAGLLLPAILIITALIYTRSYFNGITFFDDYYYILTNPFLKDPSVHGIGAIFTSFYSGNYHPLTTLTNLVEYTYFNDNPLPYHVLNGARHLLNTALVFKLISRWTDKQEIAAFVALLFGIHPMHVESVAWISERKDVLYSAFYLLALLEYERYLSESLPWRRLATVAAIFLLSLLSKSAAMTLPVLLIAIDIFKRRKLDYRSVGEKVPLLLLSVLFGILAIKSQSQEHAIISLTQHFGPLNRIFLFTTSLSAYLVNLVLPLNLAALHYYPTLPNNGLPWYYYLSLPLLAALSLGIWLVKTNKREVLFGMAFFLISISVMLQVVAVGTALYAERYSYLSYVGLCYAIGVLLYSLINDKNRSLVIGIAGCWILALMLITVNRIGVWKDSITLFTDVIEKNEGNLNTSFAYNIRGNVWRDQGDLNAATSDYKEALTLNPDLESAYFNMGHAMDEARNPDEAIRYFTQSIKLNPKYADSYNDRGWVYFKTGKVPEALEDYNRALAVDNKFAPAHNNIGWLKYKTGDTISALHEFNEAIKDDPDYIKPYYNLGIVKGSGGDLNGALAAYSRIIEKWPKEHIAYYDRGFTYFNMKAMDRACADWSQSAALGNEQAQKMLNQYCR